MAVRDPKTEQLRVDIYRQMTPQARMLIAAQMAVGVSCGMLYPTTLSLKPRASRR